MKISKTWWTAAAVTVVVVGFVLDRTVLDDDTTVSTDDTTQDDGSSDADDATEDDRDPNPDGSSEAADDVGADPDSEEDDPSTDSASERGPPAFSDLTTITLDALPPEALDTLELIEDGGPYPYRQDDGTFQNREGILPDRPMGHYREYTVETPGSPDRGARRIVAGADGERYWTDDHYDSFSEIVFEVTG